MESYRINRIYLENFKLIKTSLLIDNLSDSDFIVFDGPNGFGKTTVFDAVEIALTGEVFRIFGSNIVPGNQGADDSVFLNDQNKPLKIVVELLNNSEKKVLFVHGKSGIELSKTEKKANNRNYFKRYELANFDDYKTAIISNLTELRQSDINSWFKNVELERYYKLYHYIQQAETTFFLKQKEDERMKQLGVLFDTKVEEIDKSKIKEYYDKVVAEYNLLSNSEKEKSALLGKIESPDSPNTQNEVAYNQLLNGFRYAPEWDRESLIDIRTKDSLGVSKKDIYKIELNKLIDFLRQFEFNYNNYQNYLFNREIDSRVNKREVIKDSILVFAFIDNLKSIRELNEIQGRHLKISQDLQKENVLSKIKRIDFKAILKDLDQESQLDVFEEKIAAIQKLMEKETELSEIIRDFSSTRARLLELFSNVVGKEGKINENECPFCGYDWEGYDILIKEIESKKARIQILQDDATNEISKLLEDFYQLNVLPIVDINNSYLNNSNNRITAVFFNQVNIDASRVQNVTNFVEWLRSVGIEIEEHVFNSYNQEVTDLDDRITKFIDILLQTKRVIPEDFIYDEFNMTFSEVFEKEIEKVNFLSLDLIGDKIKYIEQEYFKGNQKEKDLLINQIYFIKNEQLPKLEEIRQKINLVLEIYENEIQNHRIEIAENIEIPFFIYSSKILQNFEKGVGVFIQFKQSNKIENLKFTQGMDTSHDVLHSMSSGQLSALVIAFTLAMNKIYDESGVGSLLIDDPVQSMDEINMASLIDLIRNDFADKQIILSTHEEDVSAFMRFKFHNFNKKTLSVNMKKEQFNLL